jgi:hypothetical protein
LHHALKRCRIHKEVLAEARVGPDAMAPQDRSGIDEAGVV